MSAEKNQTLAQNSLAAIQTSIAEKTKIHFEAANHAVQAPALEAAYKEAEQISSKRQALEELRTELNNTQKELDTANIALQQIDNNYTAAKQELLRIQETWNKGQATILASGLTDGAPCPVCGSLKHPTPAKSEVSLPSEKDIKTKQQIVADLETSRTLRN
ncbi:MAG: hypothetical protein VR69_14575 [Peptococcaceae bacterium BRH_c4b]|nr:MAG: hypothetical protein VR69_14575 [Peptococcaceae bacterium BRH_c4b]